MQADDTDGSLTFISELETYVSVKVNVAPPAATGAKWRERVCGGGGGGREDDRASSVLRKSAAVRRCHWRSEGMFSLTAGDLGELLRVPALLQHQSQRRLTDRLPGRSPGGGEEVGVVLRDEAGAHVPGLELRVARETQQEVDVGVQSHDLRVVGERGGERAAEIIKTRENRDRDRAETLYIKEK